LRSHRPAFPLRASPLADDLSRFGGFAAVLAEKGAKLRCWL
jgi:hypothetical protein